MQLLETTSSKTLHNRALTRLDMRGHRVQLTISYMWGIYDDTVCTTKQSSTVLNNSNIVQDSIQYTPLDNNPV